MPGSPGACSASALVKAGTNVVVGTDAAAKAEPVQTGQPATLAVAEEAMTPRDPAVRLRVTVFRRLLEVLPRSFGYDPVGTYTSVTMADQVARPVTITMTLRPRDPEVLPAGVPERIADSALAAARAGLVTLRVTETGFYVWTASRTDGTADEELAGALRHHIRQVIGGDFALNRYDPDRMVDGGAAARDYNDAGQADPARVRPRGILTFLQLNTIFEGLFNETLAPAVFFENYETLARWLATHDVSQSGFRDLGEIADLLMVEADANEREGQIATLAHFLARTARESLQKLTWSLESVRRALLDEMLGVLHRQSPLSQFRLFSSEWTPQLAKGATETQLRGYVMLAGAKLPILTAVHRIAESTVVQMGADGEPTGDLEQCVADWGNLVGVLVEHLHGLERAIEQSWMERLLYEEERARGQQEAVAEMERSRDSRMPSITTDTAISSLALFLAIVGALWAMRTADVKGIGLDRVWTLLPIVALGIAIYLVAVTVMRLFRWRQECSGTRNLYNYEFTFRLDLDLNPATTAKIRSSVGANRITDTAPLKAFTIVYVGGERVERVSPDKALIKHHATVSFSVGRFARAKFEAVNEIVAQKGTSARQYVLRETRLFGHSPRALRQNEIVTMMRLVLDHTVKPVLSKPDFDPNRIIELALPLYGFTTETGLQPSE